MARTSKFQDLSGAQYRRWTAISYAGNSRWLCRCQCGTERAVFAPNLKNGISKSCGCYNAEVASARSVRHGQGFRNRSGAYSSWTGIIQRCTNPKNNNFKRYGARGITVCERWLSFVNFFSDMGPRPNGTSLDRIDNNGNYEPANCRWATMEQQQNNRGNNFRIEYKGRVQTLSQWSKEVGIAKYTIKGRLEDGWTVERALTVRPRLMNRKLIPTLNPLTTEHQ